MLGVSSTALSFGNVGPAFAKSFEAGESGYTGALSATSSDARVASVSPPRGETNPQTFTVTPLAPGSVTVTISDQNGQSVSVAVTITTAPLTIQGWRR